jgi:protein-serine/threonine kinase
LIDSEGYAKITDFGLSKENIVDNTSAHSFCGTPEYLAPEILARTGHGKPVDWWSLGALIFEMLTGLPPFFTKDRERLFQNIMRSELSYPPYISPVCRSLLTQLSIKDPTQRLGTAGAHELKAHPFFASVNWDGLYAKQVRPPFTPLLDGPTDTKYVDDVTFSQEFIRIPAVDSAAREARFSQAPSSPTYDGFSYGVEAEFRMDLE